MLQVVLSYLIIYVVWSTTAFLIKTAVVGIPPFYLFGIRFLLGGAMLLVIAFMTGRMKKKPSVKQVFGSLFIGALLLFGGNGLVTIALQKVDSYLVAIVISTIPIFVLIFDKMILKTKLTNHAIIGVSFGFFGVLFLLNNSGQNGMSMHPYIFLVVVAVILWALGMTLGKKLPIPQDNLVNSGIQQFGMGLFSVLVIQPFNPILNVSWGAITSIQWFSLVYLTIFGTIAITCFLYLLKVEPNERVVTYNFINPLGSTFIGIVIGGESIIHGFLPGTILILLGLAVMFYGDKTLFFRKSIKKNL